MTGFPKNCQVVKFWYYSVQLFHDGDFYEALVAPSSSYNDDHPMSISANATVFETTGPQEKQELEDGSQQNSKCINSCHNKACSTEFVPRSKCTKFWSLGLLYVHSVIVSICFFFHLGCCARFWFWLRQFLFTAYFYLFIWSFWTL